MKIKFEEIIDLIERKSYTPPKHLTKNSFVFVSNKKWTTDYLEHYYNLTSLLKEKYNLTFDIIGGGKSCSKMITEFSENDELENLLKIFNNDPELIELSKKLDLKSLIHIADKQSLDFETKIISDTAPYYVHNTYDIFLNSIPESNTSLDYPTSEVEID